MTALQFPSPGRDAGDIPFRSFAAGQAPLTVWIGASTVAVRRGEKVIAEIALTHRADGSLTLGAPATHKVADQVDALAAAIEALFGSAPDRDRIVLDVAAASTLGTHLLVAGLALEDAGALVVPADLFWQQPHLWLTAPRPAAYPERLVLSEHIRHPRRAPKPSGQVYARFIPWLGKTLSFHVASPNLHLETFNRWMNDPRVAVIWEEEGDLAKHRAYIEGRLADPHVLPLVGYFDDAPFGYFEVYWAREDRLGPHYEADDYDRGWHVLVGEDAFRGKAFVSAWLPSLMHFMFLDDPRTRRIVGEPKSSHDQQLKNLDRSGFARVKHVDFPHKRAVLVMLLRERFFGDRLWQPAVEAEAPRAAAPPLKVASA
jgi:acetyl CoA:N6-hydroxylysine acetyl transferase